MPTLRQELDTFRLQLSRLYDLRDDPRCVELHRIINAERRPLVERVKAQIVAKEAEIAEAHKRKKPRWPVDTPAEVVRAAEDFYAGTTSSHDFRIHMWDLERKRAVISYPSGGYSDNSGWNPTPCRYTLIDISAPRTSWCSSGLKEWFGRVSQKELGSAMATL